MNTKQWPHIPPIKSICNYQDIYYTAQIQAGALENHRIQSPMYMEWPDMYRNLPPKGADEASELSLHLTDKKTKLNEAKHIYQQ